MERKISRRAVALGASLGVAGAAMASLPAFAAPSAVLYKDPAGQFSMSIPAGWSVQRPTNAGTVAQWGADDQQALVLVSSTTITNGQSSVDWLKQDYAQLSQGGGITLVDNGYVLIPVTGKNQPILRYTLTDDGGQTYQLDRVYVASGNVGWKISYITFADATADHEREFLTMAQSFALSGATIPVMPAAPAAPGATLPGAMTPPQMMPIAPVAPAAPAVVVQPKAGYIAGTVLDARGQAITAKAKITVSISGISAAAQNVSYTLPVNAMGQYSQRVSDGSYRVSATLIYTDAAGQLFTFYPEPQEPDVSYDSAAGIVKNFRWKISGPIPDTNAGSTSINDYYGWSLDLNFPQSMPAKDLPTLYPGGKIRATLTPSGPLWDGSPSATITREAPIQPLSDTFGVQMYDFPYGLYTLSVVVVDAGGTVHPLKVGPRYDLVTLPSMLLTLVPRGGYADGAYQEHIYIGA